MQWMKLRIIIEEDTDDIHPEVPMNESNFKA